MRILTHRSLYLLVAVISFYLVSPLLSQGTHLEAFIGFAFSVVIGVCGYLLIPERRWCFGVVALSGLSLVFFLGKSIYPDNDWVAFVHQFTLLSLSLFTLIMCLRYALKAEHPPPFDRVTAGVCGYFVLALAWTAIYKAFLEFDPSAIQMGGQGIEPSSASVFYYSLITLTTQGYGEIVPVNDYVRILAGMQGAFGSIYLAVFIAVLVGELKRERTKVAS